MRASVLRTLLLLCAVTRRGAHAQCAGAFRAGPDGFVLDAEEAVRDGARLLASVRVPDAQSCEQRCCGDARCNLALLPPRSPAGARTCVLFDCLHRNRFVCRFVNQEGFQSSIRGSVFQRHLQGPAASAPPLADAGRDVIVQPGGFLMLSGLQSLALGDAHIREYRWTPGGGAPVQMERTELPDQVRLSHLPPGSFTFILTVTDSTGQSDAAEVGVLVLSAEQSSAYCLAPAEGGPCRAAFPRWSYSAARQRCQEFTYGGCHGNRNNFLSQQDCEAACSGVTESAERSVVLPVAECGVACGADQLNCGDGCCLDRSLECNGVQQCSTGADEEHCSTLNRTLELLLSIDINQKQARCTQPPLSGPCRAALPRWFYDPLGAACRRFSYGGCHGNHNNFPEQHTCSHTCRGVTKRNVFSRGMFERFEEETDNSGSVAVAVLLSAAILALLAVVAYCVLRARRERRAPPPPPPPPAPGGAGRGLQQHHQARVSPGRHPHRRHDDRDHGDRDHGDRRQEAVCFCPSADL
ncbi:LOW QUALITY PROTEIN: kunitz-type protease inhibitor 1-like [Menidia menidia]